MIGQDVGQCPQRRSAAAGGDGLFLDMSAQGPLSCHYLPDSIIPLVRRSSPSVGVDLPESSLGLMAPEEGRRTALPVGKTGAQRRCDLLGVLVNSRPMPDAYPMFGCLWEKPPYRIGVLRPQPIVQASLCDSTGASSRLSSHFVLFSFAHSSRQSRPARLLDRPATRCSITHRKQPDMGYASANRYLVILTEIQREQLERPIAGGSQLTLPAGRHRMLLVHHRC